MIATHFRNTGICAGGVLVALALTATAHPADSASVKAQFANPPREYSTGPLWVWNDLLTDEQIKSTLADLAGQQVKQVWVHPRPGLMTPYLGDEWFRLWKVALAEAERLDMNVWIYDENSYPSGFAGGLVPEAMPESRGLGLHFREVRSPQSSKTPTPNPSPEDGGGELGSNSSPEDGGGGTRIAGALGEDVVAVYRLTERGIENVTDAARGRGALPEARYLIAETRLAPSRGWFGGKFYVDLLRPGVTEKFIEITFDAYKRQLGEHFGQRVPGIFTDEPHLAPAGGLHWSPGLPADFQSRWGYDLIAHLPSLVEPVGDWKRIRHNYQQLLLELFIDRWAKPCYEFCEQNNLEFTGHYWEHGWPGASHGPDNMAMYAWHQRPAIDNLTNEYSAGVHGQFGNSRTVRELASVANQLGRRRTLCETYGAGGWDLRMEDMKRIGDWLYALGVNTLNEHLSYITIRGARKRDHPQSFSYHAPWWESYHKMARYFTRLSLALSAGEQIHHVLLLQPTTTAWMYQPDSSGRPQLDAIGNSFQDMTNRLEQEQAEYDIGSEDIIARYGRIDGGRSAGGVAEPGFVVGQRRYDLVVLPTHTENLNGKTIELLEAFLAAGGEVVCCGDPPSRVDGQASDRGKKLVSARSWRRVDVEEAIARMRQRSEDGLSFHRADGDAGQLFHHRRRLEDGEILFLCNLSIDAPSSGALEATARGVEEWDLDTGQISPYTFVARPEGVRLEYVLPPCGSLLLFLSSESREAIEQSAEESRAIQPVGPPSVRRLEPNVLTLDYVDITAGGETKKNTHFFPAQQFAFVKNGMDGNPWDRAVQLRDTLITKTFPSDSGFTATYGFTIDEEVPQPLYIVIERPDLYSITCNGKSVVARAGDWWLDKSFGKVDISAAAQVGENAVTVVASPFTIFHELESAYVLGDFSLRPVDAGFVIIPPQSLALGQAGEETAAGWNAQGLPFYSAGVAYTESFSVPQPKGRYVVSLGKWFGSVAKVSVNGQLAGYIGYAPWECDVSDQIQAGNNTIEVVVIGTLRNALGPHHSGHVSKKAWPSMFQKAPESGPPPGKDYSTLSYGLFEPFVLTEK